MMASGDTLVFITALNNEPPASAFATIDTRVATSIPVLDFDPDTPTDAEFGCFMPRFFSGGDLTATIGWMASTASSGDVVWELSFKSVSDGDDLDTKGFVAATAVTSAASTVDEGVVVYVEITPLTYVDYDSIAAGEYFRIKLSRNTAAPDDMSGDAEMLFIELKEA